MGNVSKILLCFLLVPTVSNAAVGKVCYAKQNQNMFYQVMKHSKTIGSRCFITNGSFVPVYEGVVGECVSVIDCSNTGNARIR